MKNFVTFIQDIFMIDARDNHRIGLSQFTKERPVDFSVNQNSLANKDVKLSDLLRRS